jgi:hypothetical protein
MLDNIYCSVYFLPYIFDYEGFHWGSLFRLAFHSRMRLKAIKYCSSYVYKHVVLGYGLVTLHTSSSSR